MRRRRDTHSLLIGYVLWIIGFMGVHRFYFGRPVSGTVYFFTFGLLGIGWLIDLFLMPYLEERAERTYLPGDKDYSVTWLLCAFLGLFGVHRFYQGKIFTGFIYLLTGGFFVVGWLYDLWTLNEQLSSRHRRLRAEYAYL